MSQYGADPELVILDPKGNPVPAHLFDMPYKSEPISACAAFHGKKCFCRGSFHRDGYNVEVNPAPAGYFGGLWDNLEDCIRAAESRLPSGYTLSPLSSYSIDLDTLKDAPPDVQQFGCEPSLDAYRSGEPRYVTLDGYEHPMRYCGWHMHVSRSGTFLDDKSTHPMFVKMLDRYVGIFLARNFRDNNQWERRKFYGQAGEYRTQNYGGRIVGVEYRTPPAEMQAYPKIVERAYSKIDWVIDNFDMLKDSWDKSWEPITARAINTGEGLEAFVS